MNYYCAKQREDGNWDFTRNGVPTGYCRQYREWTDKDVETFGVSKDHPQILKAAEFKEKHHSAGHKTSEEAAECYKEYVLDQQISFNHEDKNSLHKCKVCGTFTSLFVILDTDLFILCEEHQNKESVASVYNAPKQIWSSW